MRILEKEIALREQTRTVQQARPALEPQDYVEEVAPLAETQDGLADRVGTVIDDIEALPDGRQQFRREIALLSRIGEVMDEATALLELPETGPQTIAAETEVIELLLQTRRINPNSGGGGGSSPGGGGGGTTQQAALALVGPGVAPNASPEPRAVQQGTGKSGRQLPEEFRYGLDAYFNALENE